MKKLNSKKKKVVAGIVGGVGALILAVLISDLAGHIEVQRYIKEDKQPHKSNIVLQEKAPETPLNVEEQEKDLETVLKEYEREIAYHTQKSDVTRDGIIGNPLYFSKLTSDYQSVIVLVKDLAPVKLDEYLNMEISAEEAVRFEKQLAEKIKASKISYSYSYQR